MQTYYKIEEIDLYLKIRKPDKGGTGFKMSNDLKIKRRKNRK